MPYMDDLASVVAQHIDDHVWLTDGNSRYRDSGLPEAEHVTVLRDIRWLATLPNGTPEAVRLAVRLFSQYWEWVQEGFWPCTSFNGSIRQICKDFDNAVVQMIRADHEIRWHTLAVEGLRTVLHEIKAKQDLWSRDSFEEMPPNNYLFFPRTLNLLHLEQHSRDTATMLAHKVAHHRLPPELVEPIAEGLYNKELLRVLEEDAP